MSASEKINAKLMLAASKGLITQVTDLLAAGAEVNARNKWGETALMAAAYQGHEQVIYSLVAAGADTSAVDFREHMNARSWALAGANREMVTKLRKAAGEAPVTDRLLLALRPKPVNQDVVAASETAKLG